MLGCQGGEDYVKPIGKEKVAEIMVGRKVSQQWMEIKKVAGRCMEH